ncbi:AraC family transcriptional regulator [Mariprofundus ferrooxydans]|uniref:AraC family transcriptional regulator n=1 Tax=Mariprofundus ferrooxydans TaxID=314344 RepID=UPI000366A188|nr:helix-turn-helix domain-containing protein [Mariprofundus ferrooxydans]
MAIKAFQIPSSFEVRFVDHASGCERPHTHSSLIVSAVLDGYISFQINENRHRLEKGVVAVVGPNILHCVRSYSDDFLGVYVLEIFGLPATCKEFNSAHFQMFKDQILQDNKSHGDFINLCKRLLSPLAETQKVGIYSEWLHNLFAKHYPSQPKEHPEYNKFADRIRKVLDEHKSESPPFEEISQLCGYSKEHCNRIFRRAYNISIQAYFLNNKAAQARDLLASDKPLSEIALECGFYDQSHFNRVFKEIFQISPAKYRAITS